MVVIGGKGGFETLVPGMSVSKHGRSILSFQPNRETALAAVSVAGRWVCARRLCGITMHRVVTDADADADDEGVGERIALVSKTVKRALV
jgi:hypothetical protein